jgi:membrane protein implicated in regulation of membrane protease activity
MRDNLWRGPLRTLVWFAFALCIIMDGAVGSYMISGPDWSFDQNGAFSTRPQPLGLTEWAFVVFLLLVQVALILTDRRLRKTDQQPSLFPQR